MINLTRDKKQEKSVLSISQIEKFYSGNNKNLIGLEYERLSLDKKTYKNAQYDKLEKIIKNFATISNWGLIYDDKTIIGAINKNNTSISLEPGCQIEISISPKKDILSIDLELKNIIESLDKIANIYDVIFVGYGISPVSNVDDIKLLSKRRYEVMNRFLPNCQYGELAQKMMRKTAGIQINIDYLNSSDAYYKLKFFNLIMPFMMGICVNSPFENNNLSDKKSQRAHVWRYTGKQRCNFFYHKIFNNINAKNNLFKNYIQEILDVPMIFIERDEKIIEINGKITFRDFMKFGYEGYFATLDDYILHQSLCFPDVRLKKYIEIRNHDSFNPQMALALCAFYKGLALEKIENILSEFEYLKLEDVEKYNEKINDFGLDYKITDKIDGWDVVAKLFNLSAKNLATKERTYLVPILDILKLRKTNADLIIDYNISRVDDLIEFLY